MAWPTYAIEADGVELDDYCDRVVVVTEGMANREDSNFKVPGLDGELSFPNKLWDAGNVIMETFIRYTDEDGLITHADGAPGHVYENLSVLKRVLGKNGLVDLRRTAPDYGETSMMVELVQGPNEGSFPAHRIWVLKAPKPFWSGLTNVTIAATAGAHIPAGDAPVGDMVVTFSGNGKVAIGDEFVEIVGHSGGAVVVDCGARTVLQSTTPRDRWLHVFSNRWLKLEPGVAQAVTFTGAVTNLVYAPHWHGGG